MQQNSANVWSQFSKSKRSKALVKTLYVLIALYILLVTFSMWKINQYTVKLFESPYQISISIREMQIRLYEMRNALPFIFDNARSYDDIVHIMKVQEEEQDRSLEHLKAHFKPNEPEFKKLTQALADIRFARRSLAVDSRGKNEKGLEEMYKERVLPYFDLLDSTLGEIGKKADLRGTEIKDQADRLILLVIVMTCIFGMVLIFFLFIVLKSEQYAYKAVRHREWLFNILSKTIDEVFVIFNKKLQIEYVSSNATRILGVRAENLLKKSDGIFPLMSSEMNEWVQELLKKSGENHIVTELDVYIEEINRQFKLRFYPVMEKKDSPVYVVVFSDQTETKEQQRVLGNSLQDALSASTAKSKFLSQMSHEIRTPMNAIIGMTTIALAKINDKVKVEDCLLKISQSSRHLLGLINDILDMSKIEENRLTIANEEFHFSETIKAVVNLIEPQAYEKNINFDVTFNGIIEDNLIGDAMRLNQILINILANAVKFTPVGGTVKLIVNRLWVKNNTLYLQFIIKDNGIGMSKEFLKKVYDPFEQANVKTAAVYGGTGIGLSITKNLVTLMRGTISVESELGVGTEFSVELPFGYSDEEEHTSTGLGNFKVLIVDDDIGTCEHASLILKKLNQETAIALDGLKAIEMVKQAQEEGKPFDVVFIDWKMPGIDGEETARRIRKIEGLNLLIIIMSAYDWTPIEKSAREAGVNGFVAKPFFTTSLKSALESINREVQAKSVLESPELYDFNGKRVLLVEDNEFNREVAKEFLKLVNADTDIASDGQEAVDKFKSSPLDYYDLILMDIQMPVMDGYEATRQIRSSGRADALTVPILAMTANAFTEDITKSLNAGMNAHISKPLDMVNLFKLLKQFLDSKTVDKN